MEVERASKNAVRKTVILNHKVKDFKASQHLDRVFSSIPKPASSSHVSHLFVTSDGGLDLHQDCRRAETSGKETGSEVQLLKKEVLLLNKLALNGSVKRSDVLLSSSYPKRTELMSRTAEGLST
jgi:hypothetical protein